MKHIAVVAVLSLAALPACGKKHHKHAHESAASASASAPAAPTEAPKPSASAAEKAAPAASAKAPAVEIKLASVANEMKYNKTKLTVKAGETVHLEFHNNSTLDVLPHNWVLVKPGTEAKVAKAELSHKADGYVAPNPDIIAHTPLAEKGKTVDVTFTAPKAGTYPYICTVPGHYEVMHGQLVVTP